MLIKKYQFKQLPRDDGTKNTNKHYYLIKNLWTQLECDEFHIFLRIRLRNETCFACDDIVIVTRKDSIANPSRGYRLVFYTHPSCFPLTASVVPL